MSAFRPRSHSSDSPVKSPHSLDISRKTCSKRGHSHTPSPTAADVGLRKRRRRDHSLSMSESPFTSRKSLFTSNNEHPGSKPVFATTSTQFNIFPKQSHRSSSPCQSSFSNDPPPQSRSPGLLDDLASLRSAAFWELRQSVAESGEGLVQRMREYERSRSRHQAHQRTRVLERSGRKRSAWRMRNQASLPIHPPSEASDDEIPTRHSTSFEHSLVSEGQGLVRPVEPMDVDVGDASYGEQQYKDFLSVTHKPASATSNSTTDEDEDEDAIFIGTLNSSANFQNEPRLDVPDIDSSASSSQSITGSPCSSVISLLLPKADPLEEDPFSAQYPSTTSEKALAALSIAFANGAGSISDYSPVWEYQRRFNTEEYDHGDLWR
ncbi:hypothetical protein CPB83DRAFT_848289 [Crepidotus variabilis]|uniref:Uncharacterized protein n=1 Tax=Crepidotus variabilis TaxID=179855 RepID=A0A9P6JSL1_9AGAR|nr:hypothetical protein CPB83DRAFT_848289 [Crepidotus variabilis]